MFTPVIYLVFWLATTAAGIGVYYVLFSSSVGFSDGQYHGRRHDGWRRY